MAFRDAFRSGNCNILISTGNAESVANLRNINIFINFDFPEKFEDYLFRLKNVKGNDPVTYSFFTKENHKKVFDLV
jgi:hypothetical protein